MDSIPKALLAIVLILALVLFGWLRLSCLAKAQSPSAPCRQVLFAGVRGTNEPATSRMLGMGPTIFPIYQKVASSAPAPGVIEGVGLNYPATVANPPWWNSEALGRSSLTGLLEHQANTCPDQRFVVVGFSQGAQIAGNAALKLHRAADNGNSSASDALNRV